MPRGVSFTPAQRKVLSRIMKDSWRQKRGEEVPQRRVRFNPTLTRSEIPVMFRKWPKKEGGDIDAIFPTIPGTNDPYTCTIYAHVGQHSSGDPVAVIQRTKAAKPSEYTDLMKELHSIGYRKLVVYNRYQHSWLDVRKRALTSIKNPGAAWHGKQIRWLTKYKKRYGDNDYLRGSRDAELQAARASWAQGIPNPAKKFPILPLALAGLVIWWLVRKKS